MPAWAYNQMKQRVNRPQLSSLGPPLPRFVRFHCQRAVCRAGTLMSVYGRHPRLHWAESQPSPEGSRGPSGWKYGLSLGPSLDGCTSCEDLKNDAAYLLKEKKKKKRMIFDKGSRSPLRYYFPLMVWIVSGNWPAGPGHFLAQMDLGHFTGLGWPKDTHSGQSIMA